MNFCTLFDSNYLDKGIVLYNSLKKQNFKFNLFVVAFDDLCEKILNDLSLDSLFVINIKEVEKKYVDLEKVKKIRSKAEYCWTCTPIIIEFCIDKYDLVDCTYIDSDLCFFSNPLTFFDFCENFDCAIVPHRFPKTKYGLYLEKRNGKFCVEFNYFKNNFNGRKILNWWINKCLEWCYDIPEEDRMGDQKYLNFFPKMFENVYVINDNGYGVAPWNISLYHLVSARKTNDLFLTDGYDEFKIVFYHFQNIRYISKKYVNIKSLCKDRKLKYKIYIPYLKEIEQTRDYLNDKWSLDLRKFKITRSSNKIVGFLQRNFAKFKIRIPSDIINLKKLSKYV